MNVMAQSTTNAPSSSQRLGNQASSESDPNILLSQSESPLANLVRRTSSRKARQTAATAARDQQYQTPPIQEIHEDSYVIGNDSDVYSNHTYTQHSSTSAPPSSQEEIYGYAYQPSVPEAESYYGHTQVDSNNVIDDYYHDPPVQQMATLNIGNPDTSGHSLVNSNGPPSPLLHSHFARGSFATTSSSDGTSYWDPDSSGAHTTMQSDYRPSSKAFRGEEELDDGSSEYGRYGYFEDDASSVYSSGLVRGPALRDSWSSTATGATVRRPDYYIPNGGTRGENQSTGPFPPTPTLIVTAEGGEETEIERRPSLLRPGPGRAPIVQPVAANFSRPARTSTQMMHVGERVSPQLPPDMREQKMKVLERNTRRAQSSNSIVSIESGNYSRPSVESRRSMTTNDLKSPPTGLQPSGKEPNRPLSPASLYSNYSYYPYESPAPSPVGGNFNKREVTFQTPEPSGKAEQPDPGQRTPQDYLQLGIQHHEANRLGESARCFERSAKEGGGCGVGMLMYGLTLRHGWGCAKNEKVGFKWLMKAAESAVGDLERMRTGGGTVEAGAVKTELVLAIYEVGQCFFHGWGVAKDQKMAVSYYGVAARLGDGDAQADLAFCLANGKGCKKDKKEAARWYREAVAQGQSDVGLAWIYKDKYQ